MPTGCGSRRTDSTWALLTGRDGLYFDFRPDLARRADIRARVVANAGVAARERAVGEAIRKTEQLVAKLRQLKQGLLHDLLTRGVDDNGELRDPDRHPEQFKDSPLGRVPNQWELSTLAETGQWLSGGAPSKAVPGFWDGPIPWVSPKDMKRLSLYDTQDHVSAAGAAMGSRILPPGSVFIVVRGMILAHTFPVCLAMTSMAFNQDVKALVPNERATGAFLAYWFLANRSGMLRLVTEATHGTKRIDLRDLFNVHLALPPRDEQERILSVLSAQESRITRETSLGDKLKLLKRGLMADLLTGRVRTTVFDEEPQLTTISEGGGR